MLIVSELALSVVLLIAAGLLIRSFLRVMRVNPGFRDGARTHRAALLAGSLTEPVQPALILNYYRQILERTQSIPGVAAAGTTTRLPLSDGFNVTGQFDIEGRPTAKLGTSQVAGYRVASSDYFRAMGIPLLRGRTFNEQDAARGAPNRDDQRNHGAPFLAG